MILEVFNEKNSNNIDDNIFSYFNIFRKDILGIPSTLINPRYISAIAYKDIDEHLETRVTRDKDFIERFINSLKDLEESEQDYNSYGYYAGLFRAFFFA